MRKRYTLSLDTDIPIQAELLDYFEVQEKGFKRAETIRMLTLIGYSVFIQKNDINTSIVNSIDPDITNILFSTLLTSQNNSNTNKKHKKQEQRINNKYKKEMESDYKKTINTNKNAEKNNKENLIKNNEQNIPNKESEKENNKTTNKDLIDVYLDEDPSLFFNDDDDDEIIDPLQALNFN